MDSGVTCHMCNDSAMIVDFHSLKQPLEVSLGDGHVLEATGHGTVALKMALPGGETRMCKLHYVLCVPALSCNLLSVSMGRRQNLQVLGVRFWMPVRS